MSTNYYAKLNYCEACGRGDYTHLGKKSGGWTFLFQGSHTVHTFNDWCQLVQSASVIEDEYGQVLTADEMIEAARTWQEGKQHTVLYPDGNWTDPDTGYSFSGYDFS